MDSTPSMEQLKFMPYRSFMGSFDAALGIDMFWYEKIMIFITYLQRLALITMFDVPWPSFFLTNARWLFVLLLDFTAHHAGYGSVGAGSVVDGCEVGCKTLWAFFVLVALIGWAIAAAIDRISMYYSVNMERLLWGLLQIAFLPFINVLVRYYMLDAGGELTSPSPSWNTPIAELGTFFLVVLCCTLGGVAYSRMSRLVLFNSRLRHETWVRARELEYLLQFTPTYRNERVWMVAHYNLHFWWWPLARMGIDLVLVFLLAAADAKTGMTLALVVLWLSFLCLLFGDVHRCWSSNWIELFSTFALCFYSLLAVLQVYEVRNAILVDSTLAEVVLGIHTGSIGFCICLCIYFFVHGHTFNFRLSVADRRAAEKWRRYFSPEALREAEEQRLLMTLQQSKIAHGGAGGSDDGMNDSSDEDYEDEDEDSSSNAAEDAFSSSPSGVSDAAPGPRPLGASINDDDGNDDHAAADSSRGGMRRRRSSNNNKDAPGPRPRKQSSTKQQKNKQQQQSKKRRNRSDSINASGSGSFAADVDSDDGICGIPTNFEEEDFVKEMRRMDAIKIKEQLKEKEKQLLQRQADLEADEAARADLGAANAIGSGGTDQVSEDRKRMSLAMETSWVGIDSASPHCWPMNQAIVNELMRRNATDHLIDYLRAARKLLDRISLLHNSPMLVPTDEIKTHIQRLEKGILHCRSERITHHANIIHPLHPIYEDLKEHLTYELRIFSEKSVTKGHNARKMIEVSRFLRMRMDQRENNLALLSPQMKRILLKMFALRIFNQLVFERAEALLPKKYDAAAKAAEARAARRAQRKARRGGGEDGDDFFDDSDAGDGGNSDDMDLQEQLHMFEDPFADQSPANTGGGFNVVDAFSGDSPTAGGGGFDGAAPAAGSGDADEDEDAHNRQLAEFLRERRAQHESKKDV